MATITGTAGDDNLVGTLQGDTFDLGQGGTDIAHGKDGADVFMMGATYDATDQIDGGEGHDVIQLDGDYSAGVTVSGAGMANVEGMLLAAGHSYALTFIHPDVGDSFALNGAALGAADTLLIDASNIGHVDLTLTSGAGNDTLLGGGGADQFDLSRGGDDVVHAGGGDDVFIFGSAFSTADQIDGGDGNETVTIDGFFRGGLRFTDTTITNIEHLAFAPHHSYHVTLANGNVAPGATMWVDASAIGSEDFYLDGRKVHDGQLVVSASYGDDTIFGGGGNDVLYGGQGGADLIRGGGGDDDIEAVNGATTVDGGDGFDRMDTFSQAAVDHMTNIERLGFTGSGSLVFNDANVGPGKTLIVNFGSNGGVSLDGSKELDGHFDFEGQYFFDTLIGGAQSDTINAGGGNDTLIGGKGDDSLFGAQGDDKLVGGAGADSLQGGDGKDRFFYLSVQDSTRANTDLIFGLNDEDQIYLKPIDANINKAGNQDFHLVSQLSGHAGELALSYDSASDLTTLQGDVDGDGKADLVVSIEGRHADFSSFVL